MNDLSKNLEDKYIMLLLKKCINFNNSKSLLISYDKVNKNFVNKVVDYANKIGIKDIYLDERDIFITRDKLLTLSLNEIEKDSYFDKSKWHEYALKHASFLMFDTEFPDVMNDVDSQKIAKSVSIQRKTKGIFTNKQLTFQVPWCYAALPNHIWAKKIFPNDENAYKKLFQCICEMCLVDDKNPIINWENYLKNMRNKINELNSLEIKSLHYKNNIGTDLTVGMSNDYFWSGICDNSAQHMIVNMPSYEIFTTPDFRKTNGIVYSTMPLVYNGGLISDFYLVFKDGKVVELDAKIGKNLLQEIINTDEQSKYLGEVALVEHNSPISKSGLIFGTTLFDENASCHLALGNGFTECFKNFENMSEIELLNLGVNQSETHEDFMIGSKDLEIEAETKNGKKLILKNGNFC